MSLDNVLAVAATAREHPAVLFIGLALSVTLMGVAANYVARLVQRYRWIAWGRTAAHPLCGPQDDLRWRRRRTLWGASSADRLV
jgi:hypothetical protein